jgi:hypothetical protein
LIAKSLVGLGAMDQTARAVGVPARVVADMRMRKFESKTQAAYLRAVKKLATFLKRSPDTAAADDLRRFQLHLVDEGCGVEQVSYNSCRNRHCPKCQSSAAKRWLQARQSDLLPVEYSHVDFTLPETSTTATSATSRASSARTVVPP